MASQSINSTMVNMLENQQVQVTWTPEPQKSHGKET